MPWEYGKYNASFTIENNTYSEYSIDFKSKHGVGEVQLQSTCEKMKIHSGFTSLEEQLLILTHPVTGYYYLKNGQIGSYEIWHPQMELYEGKSQKIYFELFENLGFLSREEMNEAHSILMTKEIEFDILMPPRKL